MRKDNFIMRKDNCVICDKDISKDISPNQYSVSFKMNNDKTIKFDLCQDCFFNKYYSKEGINFKGYESKALIF